MKLWMYKLNCHNTRMTRVDYIIGVVQAATYNEAERKVASMMNDYQTLQGLHEVDFDNPNSIKMWIVGGRV